MDSWAWGFSETNPSSLVSPVLKYHQGFSQTVDLYFNHRRLQATTLPTAGRHILTSLKFAQTNATDTARLLFVWLDLLIHTYVAFSKLCLRSLLLTSFYRLSSSKVPGTVQVQLSLKNHGKNIRELHAHFVRETEFNGTILVGSSCTLGTSILFSTRKWRTPGSPNRFSRDPWWYALTAWARWASLSNVTLSFGAHFKLIADRTARSVRIQSSGTDFCLNWMRQHPAGKLIVKSQHAPFHGTIHVQQLCSPSIHSYW